ncbi:unnamed protein product, partial [Heterosigma akashiwo]
AAQLAERHRHATKKEYRRQDFQDALAKHLEGGLGAAPGFARAPSDPRRPSKSTRPIITWVREQKAALNSGSTLASVIFQSATQDSDCCGACGLVVVLVIFCHIVEVSINNNTFHFSQRQPDEGWRRMERAASRGL